MGYCWPSEEQWAYIQSQADTAGKVTMLNLLKFRESADYSGHPEQAPCSGHEAYERYKQHAVPLVAAVGGELIFSGTALATVIGPADRSWDEVVVAEYPSMKAFAEMAGSAAYQAIAYHRAAALEDSRLIPMRR